MAISGTNQILFNTFAGSPGDYVRVLTAFSPGATVTPEPGSTALVLTGSLLVFACVLRKRHLHRT